MIAGAGKLPGRYDARELARLCGISGARLPAVVAALQAAELAGAMSRDGHGLWAVALAQEASLPAGVEASPDFISWLQSILRGQISAPLASDASDRITPAIGGVSRRWMMDCYKSGFGIQSKN